MKDSELVPPEAGKRIAIRHVVLPADAATRWAAWPDCGAFGSFCGIVRAYSKGPPGVTGLEHEPYEVQKVPQLTDVANKRGQSGLSSATWSSGIDWESRRSVKWPVVVLAATPHRAEAFAVAEFCIDTIKHTVLSIRRTSSQSALHRL